MKRTFILLSAACISLTATAQTATKKTTTKTTSPKSSGWVINPGLSLASAAVTTDYKDINDEINPIFSLQPGVNIGYMLNPHIGFFAGLAYTTNGFKVTQNTEKLTTRNGFLDIPVFVRIITSKAEKVGFIADLGIATGFMMSANTKYKEISSGYTISSTSKEGYNKTVVSGIMFLGVKVPVHPIVNVLAGFDYQVTFSDMNNPKAPSSVNYYRGGIKVSAAIKLTNN